MRRGRVLGGPAVRAAYGGNLTLAWLPRRVIWQERQGSTLLLRTGGIRYPRVKRQPD
jgi:hypothetical protein